MQPKLSRNSRNKVSEGSSLKIRHNITMEKENLTHGMKDKARKSNLKRAIPRQRQGRVTGSLRKTLESGVSSTISPGTT
jgi:hypothetical protein